MLLGACTVSLSAPQPNVGVSDATSAAVSEAGALSSYAPTECGCRKTRTKLKDRIGPALEAFEPDTQQE